MFGQVDNVDYGYGATVISSKNFNGKGAFTMGSYILGPEGIRADYKDHLFVHEYGHVLQSIDFGFYYLPLVGIPSVASYNWDNENKVNLHSDRWFEANASKRAANYFEKRETSFDRISFVTGSPSSYINPRTGYKNRRAHPIKGQFDNSDLLINFPGINLFYILYTLFN